MGSVDLRLEAQEVLDDAGECFLRALEGLIEAHCQDVRCARALAGAGPWRSAAGPSHKGSDEPVDEPAEGPSEWAEEPSEGRIDRRVGSSFHCLLSGLQQQASENPCSLRRPHKRRSTAAAKLQARTEVAHGVSHDSLCKSAGKNLPVQAQTTTMTGEVSSTRLNELIPGLKSMFGDNLLARILSSVAFEVCSAGIVLVFCVVTALQMQREGLILGYELSYPHYSDPATQAAWTLLDDILQTLSATCGVLFVVEFAMRLTATGKHFLRDVWCYFDLIMISGWVAELIGEAIGSSSARALRPARLARLLRFIRMINIIRRLESLYFMVRALSGSVKTLGWACLLLFGFQTLTAFVITELLYAFYFPRADLGPEASKVFEYFGSFSRSLLTTFEMALGNWPIPARVLMEHVTEWFILIFLAHKLLVGFAFLSIINAVFIQETFQVASTDDLTMVLKKQKLVDTQRKKLERLFVSADTSNDGRISREEFTKLLKHKDVRMWLASMDYTATDPHGLFDMLDYDCTGDLSALEFLTGMVALRGTARAMDLVGLVEMQLEHDQMLKRICQALSQEGEDTQRKVSSETCPNSAEYQLDFSASSHLFR